MAKMKLNLEAVSTSASFSVLESGMYPVSVTGAEIVENKAKTGHILNVTLTVTEGSDEGKSIINRMNIVNKNPDTVKWALRDLKTIMTVGGHSNPNFLEDSDELLGLTFNVSLEKKPQLDKEKQPVCNDKGEPYFENKYNGFFKASATPAAKTETKTETKTEEKEEVKTETAQTETKAQGEFPWS